MDKVSKRWAGTALAGLLAVVCGCNHEDADKLARVGRRVAGKLDGAAGGAQAKLSDSLQAVRGGWEEVALDARVTARLRWDKALGGTRITALTQRSSKRSTAGPHRSAIAHRTATSSPP
ncbi:MAG: hypothetical protein JO306_09395 [Gemmatimonadetes bacterium]|nr:hypothetical protein [Gemmatimonadota bacterium]